MVVLQDRFVLESFAKLQLQALGIHSFAERDLQLYMTLNQ
jgi:hypothetical protein